jgi:hypothetical protein
MTWTSRSLLCRGFSAKPEDSILSQPYQDSDVGTRGPKLFGQACRRGYCTSSIFVVGGRQHRVFRTRQHHQMRVCFLPVKHHSRVYRGLLRLDAHPCACYFLEAGPPYLLSLLFLGVVCSCACIESTCRQVNRWTMSDSEKPQCGGGGLGEEEYDFPLHLAAVCMLIDADHVACEADHV